MQQNNTEIEQPGSMWCCSTEMTLCWDAYENKFKGWYCSVCNHQIYPIGRERQYKLYEEIE